MLSCQQLDSGNHKHQNSPEQPKIEKHQDSQYNSKSRHTDYIEHPVLSFIHFQLPFRHEML